MPNVFLPDDNEPEPCRAVVLVGIVAVSRSVRKADSCMKRSLRRLKWSWTMPADERSTRRIVANRQFRDRSSWIRPGSRRVIQVLL
jgi:hypothetical protein